MCDWFEYTIPGNIHYGYVGRAGGFSASELHFGASYAEITDPAHRELLKVLGKWFINLHVDLSCLLNIEFNTYVNFKWWRTGFDDPYDFSAVSLGTELYGIAPHPANLTYFGGLLDAHSASLMHMPDPLYSFFHESWPYPNGFFDGGG